MKHSQTYTDRRSAYARGYDTRWQHARKAYLAKHPLCRLCEADGRVTPATVVDHIIPHRGDKKLFWDSSNWQALCQMHHDGIKRRMESHYRKLSEPAKPAQTLRQQISDMLAPACDADGNPRNTRHHWNERQTQRSK